MTGRTKVFDAPSALRLLLGAGDLDPKVELARLNKERADNTALKNAELRSELIPREHYEESVISLCSALASRLGAVPSKAAPEVRISASDVEAEEVLRRFIDEARDELAAAGERVLDRVARRSSRRPWASSAGSEVTSEEDGVGMVGRGEGAVSGELGGAGPVENGSS